MRLFRNFATVGAATLSSRFLGFFRDILIAASIGTGPVADAFFVAFRLPNLFRRLFAEGAFNAAFVPLFAKEVESNGKAGSRAFAEQILAILFWTLLILTIVAEIAAPVLVYILAPGFYSDPAKFDLAVLLSRITFPYLLCMSILAFISGILNTFHRFAAAAFAPVLLNVVMIAVLSGVVILGLGPTEMTGIILAVGVTIAGIVQVLALIFALKHFGFQIKLGRPRVTPHVKRLLALGIPGVIAGGITQINIAVGTIIASAQAGAVSYLYYADRIYQLPLGVVGIAIGVVLLPNISRQLKAGDMNQVFQTQNRSLEFGLALTLPAAVALVVIPEPIISVLFERGAFGADDTALTTAALAAFGLGLPAFVLIKVFSPGFFAREDTKTPMWFAGVSMVVNVAGSLVLFPLIGHVGIALSTSVAGWINAILLGGTLWKRGYFRSDTALLTRLPLLCIASVLMGAIIWYGADTLSGPLHDPLLAIRFSALAGLVALGMASFAFFVQVTGAVDLLGHLRKAIAGRSASSTTPSQD
ncbi:MAG: murein biosynthesis integral membrane protein MurJ [Stappiaceae bacterium]